MSPRFVKIFSILMVIAIIFVARLAYLQLFTDRYALNAMNTSIKIEYIIPQRGGIFDRNGKILVGNQPAYEVSFTEALMNKDFDTLGFCSLMKISKQDFINRVKAVEKDPYYSKLNPITFIKDLSREDVARIQEVIFKYPAFDVVTRPQRQYEVSTSGNLLGYIREVNAGEIKKDSTYYLPGDFIGKTGIEKAYEKELRGVKGMKHVQKDIKLRSIGSYKNGELDVEQITGKDITLTIDYDLQKLAQEMLVNKRGAIVALDPNNGEILTLASGPGIDPSLFTGPNKSKQINALIKDNFNQPMLDRSLQAGYPPGSTFKMYTALAGMQMGVMDEKTVFPCGGGFNYRGLRVKGHGGADPLVPAIQVSSNCYFSYAFIAIMNKYPGNPSKGINEWKRIMSSFGFGEFLNNDLAVGAKGFIPDSEFYVKRSDNKEDWTSAYTMNGSIFNGMGQGAVSLTPLQMANGVAAIANKGWFYTPHIVKSIDGKPNPDPRFKVKHKTLVDAKHFEPILKGMEAVVLGGTARGLKSNDFTQLAKTGTAQVPQGKDNSIFVLIAPKDKPKIVVVAVMEHAGFGATWAGPACTLVAEKYLTGDIKREHLYKKMVSASFMPEYERQRIADLKRKGLYVDPKIKQDSIKQKRKADSIKNANSKIQKLQQSVKVEQNTQKPKTK